jgi:hypothetical protein
MRAIDDRVRNLCTVDYRVSNHQTTLHLPDVRPPRAEPLIERRVLIAFLIERLRELDRIEGGDHHRLDWIVPTDELSPVGIALHLLNDLVLD